MFVTTLEVDQKWLHTLKFRAHKRAALARFQPGISRQKRPLATRLRSGKCSITCSRIDVGRGGADRSSQGIESRTTRDFGIWTFNIPEWNLSGWSLVGLETLVLHIIKLFTS